MAQSRKKKGYHSAYRGKKQSASGPQVESCKHNSFIFQFDELQTLVDEPQKLVKENCDLFEKIGEYGFQNAYVFLFTIFFLINL